MFRLASFHNDLDDGDEDSVDDDGVDDGDDEGVDEDCLKKVCRRMSACACCHYWCHLLSDRKLRFIFQHYTQAHCTLNHTKKH